MSDFDRLVKSLSKLGFALILFMSFRWALFEPFVIPSGSMIPSLLINDHIVVKKWSYGLRYPFSKKWIYGPKTPERTDVVVFKNVKKKGVFMVKRVIGLPGDEISYFANGQIKVNGQLTRLVPLSIDKFKAAYPSIDEYDLRYPFDRIEINYEAEKKYLTILNKFERYREPVDVIVPEGHLFVMGDNRDRSADSRSWGFVPLENLMGQASFIWLSCDERLSGSVCDPSQLRWSRFFQSIH